MEGQMSIFDLGLDKYEETSEATLKKERKKESWFRACGANKSGADEWYTPREAVNIIFPYIKPKSKILCPFDTSESQFVIGLKEQGHTVLHSHISEGVDFFELQKPDVEYIISNPPFSKRDAILERLYEWQIPFAMVFNTNGLFDSKTRSELAQKYGAELIYIYPRVRFIDANGDRNSPPFQSCFWCYKMVPEILRFEFLGAKE